jgi:hypothetical protein
MNELVRTEGGRLRCANFTGQTIKRICLLTGPAWVSRIDEWRRGQPDLPCPRQKAEELTIHFWHIIPVS